MANFLIGTAVSLGVSALASLFAPHQRQTQTIEKNKQDSFSQPRSSYGDYISQVWGEGRVGGILVYAKFPIEERVSESVSEQKTGGKGGGGSTTTTVEKTYTYWGDCAFVCSTQITAFKEIRLNSILAWKDGNLADSMLNGCSVRTYLGTGNQSTDSLLSSLLGSKAQTYAHRSIVVFENLPLTNFGNTYPQASALVENGSFPTLASVVSSLCLESPYLSATDIDVTDLQMITVRGFQIDREMAIAEKLAILQKSYFFDILDTGDKIIFQRQYRAAATSFLPEDYLSASEEGQPRPDKYSESRSDPTTLPSQYECRFFDTNNNGQQGFTRSSIIGEHRNLQIIDYPGSLSESEAKDIAQKNLWLDWTRGGFQQEVNLPIAFLTLDPGDIIGIDRGGITNFLQISQFNLGANGLILLRTTSYNSQIYGFAEVASAWGENTATAIQGTPISLGTGVLGVTSVSSGATTYVEGVDYSVNLSNGTLTPIVGGGIANSTEITIGLEQQQQPQNSQLPPTSNTALRVLDINQVYDSDARGLYIFADGDSNWRNASLYASYDNANYSYQGALLTRSLFGTCDTILPSGTTTGIDATSTVDITVPDHTELSSISLADLDAGKNRALVGSEILGFQAATLLGASGGTRQYRLSNFYRGLRGTIGTVGGHAANEKFYLLSGYKFILPGTAADIGKTIYLKAICDGQELSDVTATSLVIVGNALNQWIPTIIDFAPIKGPIGETVTIFGKAFTGATTIKFNAVNAASFTVVSDTTITAVVATATTTGKISITAPNGTGTSFQDFTIGPRMTRVIRTQTLPYTLASSDLLTRLLFNGAGTLSIPDAGTVFPQYWECEIMQIATNGPLLAVVAAGTATLLFSGGSSFNQLARPNGICHILHAGSNVWHIVGANEVNV